MKLWANFVSAVWGMSLGIMGCALWSHNYDLMLAGAVIMVIATFIRLLMSQNLKDFRQTVRYK